MTTEKVPYCSSEVKQAVELYAKALADTAERKVCTELGKSQSVSHDKMRRILSRGQETIDYVRSMLLDELTKRTANHPKGTFALDDGSILKQYAEKIEGLYRIRDGATGMVANGLATVVIGWSDEDGFLPLDHAFWFAEEIIGKETYQTKQQLAQQLVLRYETLLKQYGISLDGLYATQDMIRFFNEHEINFTMKMHANRVVEREGVKKQLKHHPALKLYRNSRDKTIKATWHEFQLFITIEKMRNKDGSIAYRYLMSNKERPPKEYISLYWLRWPIEEFFRTGKQKLGFSQCQSTSIEKQKAHIFNVFYAYARLQEKSRQLDFDSVDALIKYLRYTKSRHDHNPVVASDQIFPYYA
jgi:hypothetical protein